MKKQLTLGEGIATGLMLAGAILTSWITNVQAISTLQTKQDDDRRQIEQFREDTRERLLRIEEKIDKISEKQYEKQTH